MLLIQNCLREFLVKKFYHQFGITSSSMGSVISNCFQGTSDTIQKFFKLHTL